MKKVQTVLLVDDDAMSNFLMRELIREQGLAHNIVSKESISDGLQYLTSCTAPPELILLDLYIAEETGFDFLRIYSELGLDKHPSKIVLLSGYLSDADREHAKSYKSVVEMCIKPLEMDQLATIINDL